MAEPLTLSRSVGRLPAFRWTKSVLQTVDVATGQLRGQHQLPPFFSATMLDHERLLAYTLSNGLVEMELDPADGHLRSEPRQVGSPGEVERSLSASRDGLVVVGIVRTKPGPPSVQVGEFDPTTKRLTNPQPLAASGIETFSHAWTPDNRAVIYESNSFGALDLYRMQARNNVAKQFGFGATNFLGAYEGSLVLDSVGNVSFLVEPIVAAVPEPATFAFGLAMLGACATRRFRTRSQATAA